jgi:CCAAT-binding transcription factor (CBF-B/NF-YA) subunit B
MHDLSKYHNFLNQNLKSFLLSIQNMLKHSPEQQISETNSQQQMKFGGQRELESIMNYNAHPEYADQRHRFDATYADEYNFNGMPINPRQIYWIKKRRVRREILDSLMIAQKSNYLHESRHRHAMKRMRAPSGRFLTKEETEEARRREETNR